MFQTVELPLWLLVLILLFAAVTASTHLLFPSVRWFFRRRAERLVARLNERLERPIQPFKMARRTDMIQRLIYDPEVADAVAEHARTTGPREDVAFQKVRRYAREIVPAFSAWAYYRFGTRAARWLSRALYRVKVEERPASPLASVDRESTVIYVMNHRSNMDYVLVTYIAAPTAALSYAVGEWARIWPLIHLIRAMGGYFIRRNSRSPLYRRVLQRYVQLATRGGVSQGVFPEGGLSQSGALGKPKLGILSYIIDGADTDVRDIVFLPVAVNYDRVIEDRLLIEAGEKGERRYRGSARSAAGFVLRYISRRLQRKADRFGGAAVAFGKPLSLRDLSPEQRAPEDIAATLMARIGGAIPVLPVPLMASVLVEAETAMTRTEIMDAMRDRAERIAGAGGHLFLPDTGGAGTFAEAFSQLNLREIVEEEDGHYTVQPGKMPILRYYAASLSQVPGAMTRVDAAQKDAAQ